MASQLAVIELYIVVEPITQYDLTQPLITLSHEGQTLTEECGPNNQHHYVPFEQSHLDEQVIMNAQTLQVDHLDDEFIDRIVSESRHHLDVDDQYEDSDIEIAISGGGVDGQAAAADDDDDDDDNNALRDDRGEQEHAMPSYRIMWNLHHWRLLQIHGTTLYFHQMMRCSVYPFGKGGWN